MIKREGMKKRGKWGLAALSMALFLGGCNGSEEQQAFAENIELIDPVNTVAEYEEVAYRTLYDVEIYSASVLPYVAEYAFVGDETFAGYGALPGESVEKNDILVYSDSENIDNQIEAMEERIESLDEGYLEYKTNLEEEWETTRQTLQYNKDVYESCLRNQPKPYVKQENTGDNSQGGDVSGEAGGSEENGSEDTTDPAYEEWERAYAVWKQQTTEWEGKYRKLAHSIDMQEKALSQRKELYELDRAYYVKQLESLKEQKKDGSILSGMSGEIVAINSDIDYGSNVAKETPIVAVGDSHTKVLKCNYINSMVMNRAKEYYALIDGVRYGVDYHFVSAEEYTELTAAGETVYSTFYLTDAGEEVQIGDFAVIVVVTERKENVLSIPKEAIHKDESGHYVYVLENDDSVYTYVETGMTDGAYTEIESGLAVGQKVLLTAAGEYGSNVATVQTGSFSSEFSASGYMYYPSSRMVQNPIQHGTVYFEELLVSQYQYVEKGDVIATVRVEMNELELQRQQTKLQRLEERLQDYVEQNQDNTSAEYAEVIAENIAARQEAIAEVRELITDMKEDGAATEIKADRSGVIIWTTGHGEEDILYYNENLIQVADEETCYVIVENTNQLLNYGNRVSISYEDKEGATKTASGTVASISRAGVSSAIDTEYSMILLPPEVISDMAVATQGYDGWWNRNRYTVTATIREMNGVLLVPRGAVTDIGGNTYVNVIDENGKVTAQSFVAGGYDSANYWVVEGLSEGMNVCLK